MSKKELQEMKKELERQHAIVTKSKAKARKLLLDLNLITPTGRLSKSFKPIKY